MRSPFSKNFDPAQDLPDLKDKIIIVTGGNSGLGYASVKYLARRGAKVYLAARNETKANDAIARLKEEGLGPGNGQVVWLKLNLSDPREAKKSAERFLTLENRLDVLVNNAGTMVQDYTKSFFGVQDSMMVNYISPFVFTRTLLPLLTETAKQAGSDVRIVNVASEGHRYVQAGVRFRNVDDFNLEYKGALMARLRRYWLSKLASILFSKQLQRRLDADGISITVIAIDPGAVNTNWAEDLPFPRLASFVGSLFLQHPDKAAYTQVIAAAAKDVKDNPETYKGNYLVPIGQVSPPSAIAQDPELAIELWKTTEEFLASINV